MDVLLARGSETVADAGDVGIDFKICHAMRVAHELELWGNLDRCPTLAEVNLEFWRGNEYEERQLFFATAGRRNGGRCARSRCRCSENTSHSRHRRARDVLASSPAPGHGPALLLATPKPVRRGPRPDVPATPTPSIPPGAVIGGAGCCRPNPGPAALPPVTPAVAFAPAAGYELEQVERSSRLELPR